MDIMLLRTGPSANTCMIGFCVMLYICSYQWPDVLRLRLMKSVRNILAFERAKLTIDNGEVVNQHRLEVCVVGHGWLTVKLTLMKHWMLS